MGSHIKPDDGLSFSGSYRLVDSLGAYVIDSYQDDAVIIRFHGVSKTFWLNAKGFFLPFLKIYMLLLPYFFH